MERSLVLVKPDGVQRGLVGKVITALEDRGLRLTAARFLRVSQELAEAHYGVHAGKPFYDALIAFITSSPVMAMVWEGPDAIAAIRQTMGKTRGTEAAPGSIRHDYALQARFNITHASDSPENAEAEIALWFKPEEIVVWSRDIEKWIYE
ncbi:MAG TPA: nucleoside-diphosphate kinase [Anaerolineaceae bacterium]|nr:nucleoside-diphosphate kinase [Anaerolineaceae bacterium]HOR83238.1 nucleoside-diphosphate kinase [Anaerolineaceae bacterium]HPL43184.1 nucleoside-diphosphate kinase [Anaerolineaceae bacterium]